MSEMATADGAERLVGVCLVAGDARSAGAGGAGGELPPWIARAIIEGDALALREALRVSEPQLTPQAFIEALSACGAGLDAIVGKSGRTPLGVAIRAGWLEGVKALTAAGADLNAPCGPGDGQGGALAEAFARPEAPRAMEILHHLLESGARILTGRREQLRCMLIKAVSFGRPETIGLLVKAGVPVADGPLGGSALEMAALRAHLREDPTAMVAALLAGGADPRWAAVKFTPEAVRAMLRNRIGELNALDERSELAEALEGGDHARAEVDAGTAATATRGWSGARRI